MNPAVLDKAVQNGRDIEVTKENANIFDGIDNL